MTMQIRHELQKISSPVHTSTSEGKPTFNKEFLLSAECVVFSGHFPHHPVLPAVAQVLMAEITVSEAIKKDFCLSTLTQAKFMQAVPPNSTVLCSVLLHTEDQWDCLLTIGKSPVARFRMKGIRHEKA